MIYPNLYSSRFYISGDLKAKILETENIEKELKWKGGRPKKSDAPARGGWHETEESWVYYRIIPAARHVTPRLTEKKGPHPDILEGTRITDYTFGDGTGGVYQDDFREVAAMLQVVVKDII